MSHHKWTTRYCRQPPAAEPVLGPATLETARTRHRSRMLARALVRWREIRVAMHQRPRAIEATVYVRDTNDHGLDRGAVDCDVSTLHAHCIRDVAACENDTIIRNECASTETTANPPEGIDEPLVTLFDRPPRAEQRHVMRIRPAVDIRLRIT